MLDVHKKLAENIQSNSALLNIPPRAILPKEQWTSLFDYPLMSPIGIPACVIMTGQNIATMSTLGFDVLTYRTIRSIATEAHPAPNSCFVNCSRQLMHEDIGTVLIQKEEHAAVEAISIANSFGNACPEPQWTMQDIVYARSVLRLGQVLQVSVYGTEQVDRSYEDDFVYTAQQAQDAGAQVIEINASCPNYCGQLLYKQVDELSRVVRKVVKGVTIPVTVKVGIFDSDEYLKNSLSALARAGVRGVCGINTIPMRIINQRGDPVFGQRLYAGISGYALRSLALSFIKTARAIIDTEKLGLTLLATGGVLRAEDFTISLELGADIAMSATGAMCNSYIAHEWHQKKEISYGHTRTYHQIV